MRVWWCLKVGALREPNGHQLLRVPYFKTHPCEQPKLDDRIHVYPPKEVPK